MDWNLKLKLQFSNFYPNPKLTLPPLNLIKHQTPPPCCCCSFPLGSDPDCWSVAVVAVVPAAWSVAIGLSSLKFKFLFFCLCPVSPLPFAFFDELCWLYFSICELWLTGFYWTSVFTVLLCCVMSCVDCRLSWCSLRLWIETWVLTIDYCVKCK